MTLTRGTSCIYWWPEDGPQWPKHVVVSTINRIQDSCVVTYRTPSLIAYNTTGMIHLQITKFSFSKWYRKKKNRKAVSSNRGTFHVQLSRSETNTCHIKCSVRSCRDVWTNSLPRSHRSLPRTALAHLLSRAYRETLEPFVFAHSGPCVHIYPPFSAAPCEFCFLVLSPPRLLHATLTEWTQHRLSQGWIRLCEKLNVLW